MKKLGVFVFLALVAVFVSGCVTTSPFVQLPTGEVVMVQQYGPGYVAAPLTESGARTQARLVESGWRHQEKMSSIWSRSADQARDDQRADKKLNADIYQRKVQTMTGVFQSVFETHQRNHQQVVTERTPPREYRPADIRRQERVTTTSAPQRQKIVSSPPTQRQPRQVSAPQRQSTVTKLAPAPLPRR